MRETTVQEWQKAWEQLRAILLNPEVIQPDYKVPWEIPRRIMNELDPRNKILGENKP